MAHSSRHGSAWRSTTQPSVRHGGAWRTVTAAWVRNAGAWSQWWPDGPALGGPYLFGTIASCGPNVCRYTGSVWDSVGGGRDASVGSAAVDSTGRICCWGGFTSPTRLAIWDGTSWSQPAVPTAYTGTIEVHTDGDDFFLARDVGAGSDAWIYHVNASYNTWNSVSDSFGNAYWTYIAMGNVSGDTVGFAYGNFTSPQVANIFWDQYGSNYNISVYDTYVYMQRCQDGNAYLTTYGSYPTSYVYQCAMDDSWTRLDTGTGFNNLVTSVAAGGGMVYAAGAFTSVDGVSAAGLAEWDGAAWSAIGAGLSSVIGMVYYQSKLWILQGATATARKVYTWDGASLVEQSDWAGDTVVGIV